MEWRAPGLIGESIGLTINMGDSVVLDTTVVVDGGGRVRTRALPAAEYSYRITTPGEDGTVGTGRIESERHSLELLRPPVDLSSMELDESAQRRARRELGRPLRTHPGPYLLILVLLSVEWIGRRRGGLR